MGVHPVAVMELDAQCLLISSLIYWKKPRKLPRLLSHSNTANFSSYRGNYRGYLGITEFLITVSVSTVESTLSDLERRAQWAHFTARRYA